MGRKRSISFDLPPRMHRRGERFYYVTGTRPRKWIALGADLNEARRKWAELEGEAPDPNDKTFSVIARRYRREIMPTKAVRTRRDNEKELEQLEVVFGAMPIDAIRPTDVHTYPLRQGQKKGRCRLSVPRLEGQGRHRHRRSWARSKAAGPQNQGNDRTLHPRPNRRQGSASEFGNCR